MATKTLEVPWMDDTDRGKGAVAEWLGELAEGTRQVEPATMLRLSASKLAIYGAASIELLQDAPAFESDLRAQLSARLGLGLDQSFLTGNGVGKPLGVLNAPCTITVAAEAGQAADTIVTANILKMLSRLVPACWKTAVWLAHPSCLPQLLKLQVTVTNVAGSENVGGSATPLFSESGGTFRLAGKELVITEKLSQLGDLGDIMLCDFSKYLIGMRLDAGFERNNSIGWTSYATDFRMVFRVAGLPAWSARSSRCRARRSAAL